LGDGVQTVGRALVETVHEMAASVDGAWIEEWPRRVWMVLGCSPAAISQAAWVCLRSCIRQGGPTEAATAVRQIRPNEPRLRTAPFSEVRTML